MTRGYPRLGAVRPVSSRRRRVGCARGWRRIPPTAAFSEPSRNLLGSFPLGGGASLLPRRLARPGRRRLRPRQGSQHTHPPGPRPRTQTVEIGTGRQTDESQKAALGPGKANAMPASSHESSGIGCVARSRRRCSRSRFGCSRCSCCTPSSASVLGRSTRRTRVISGDLGRSRVISGDLG